MVEMKGLSRIISGKLQTMPGFPMSFLHLPPEMSILLIRKIRKSQISIDARLETDNYAETKKWGLTAPFITMQLARVTRSVTLMEKSMLLLQADQTASNQLQMQMATQKS